MNVFSFLCPALPCPWWMGRSSAEAGLSKPNMLKQENLNKQIVSQVKLGRKKVVGASLWTQLSWMTDNVADRCVAASGLAWFWWLMGSRNLDVWGPGLSLTHSLPGRWQLYKPASSSKGTLVPLPPLSTGGTGIWGLCGTGLSHPCP